MEVTVDNFNEVYPRFIQLLERAVYVSFDEEMTGIMGGSAERNRKDDDPETRYQKMIIVANKFSIIQFGLCIFCEEISTEEGVPRLVAYPFNFYLFPAYGRDIIMSASSIDFLKKNNMDFNTWITKGITYTDEEGDTWAYKKHLEPILAMAPSNNDGNSPAPVKRDRIVLTKQSDIDFINRNIESLQDYISAQTATTSTDSAAFQFEPTNAFLRRVIYETIDDRFPQIEVCQSKVKAGALEARIVSADKEVAYQKKRNDAQLAYETNLGFRRLFKELVKAKLPVVGHNCFFDLLFLTRACVGTFPESLASYKTLLHTYFPVIFDTKYLGSSGCLGYTVQDTTLSDIYDYYHQKRGPVNDQVAVRIEDGWMAAEQYHSAGYDAYATGYVFAQQVYGYRSDGSVSWRDRLVDLTSAAADKLFMMQSLYHMDLHPDHPHGILKSKGILIFVECPSSTNNTDILAYFDAAGLNREAMEILWIDGYSLIVDLGVQSVLSSSIDEVIALLRSRNPSSSFKIDEYFRYKESRSHPPVVEEVVADQQASLTQRIVSLFQYLFSPKPSSEDAAPTPTQLSGVKRAREDESMTSSKRS
jgi:hypothetical protein